MTYSLYIFIKENQYFNRVFLAHADIWMQPSLSPFLYGALWESGEKLPKSGNTDSLPFLLSRASETKIFWNQFSILQRKI